MRILKGGVSYMLLPFFYKGMRQNDVYLYIYCVYPIYILIFYILWLLLTAYAHEGIRPFQNQPSGLHAPGDEISQQF